ncbi:MAG: phosphotransferase family protein [Chloroflexi bacterium]|nr:phosphotransferase family protein [Chloroflexota bacterium]
MQSTVPAGINYQRVSEFFATNVPGGAVELDIQLLSGGRSNLTYIVRGGGNTWVLRRPPLGHVLPTAHDMAREYKVLAGLATTDVPAPRPVALCEDPEVNGFPFYVMNYCEGVIIADSIPPGFADTEDARRRMSMALVDTLVKLHAVDYNAVGLADFGRPEGYLERQVRRWSQQWERSKTREVPAIDEVIRRLNNALPPSPPPTIVHGDYRLGNMILAPDDPGRVVAILDWEMATLGDPLSDLGYTLIYWGDVTDSPARLAVRPTAALTAQPGFFTRDEIVAEYARRTGRNVEHVDYYQVLANYKLAVITEGIHARFLAGETVGEGFGGMGESASNLINLALSIADASHNPKLRGVA